GGNPDGPHVLPHICSPLSAALTPRRGHDFTRAVAGERSWTLVLQIAFARDRRCSRHEFGIDQEGLQSVGVCRIIGRCVRSNSISSARCSSRWWCCSYRGGRRERRGGAKRSSEKERSVNRAFPSMLFTILRLDSPLEPFFTKTWRLSEIELAQ